MQVGKLFRSYILNLPERSPLSLEIVYAAAAKRIDEARRLWIEKVKQGKKRLPALSQREVQRNQRRGQSIDPLVGSGKFLRDVRNWEIQVLVGEPVSLGDIDSDGFDEYGYPVQGMLKGGESAKVLRKKRQGERDVDLTDEYQNRPPEEYWDQVLRDNPDRYQG